MLWTLRDHVELLSLCSYSLCVCLYRFFMIYDDTALLNSEKNRINVPQNLLDPGKVQPRLWSQP
jgi:hypothetical protein